MFQSTYLYYWDASGQNFSKIEYYLWEQEANNSKKGHFMDAELVQETLKIFNFKITYMLC